MLLILIIETVVLLTLIVYIIKSKHNYVEKGSPWTQEPEHSEYYNIIN